MFFWKNYNDFHKFKKSNQFLNTFALFTYFFPFFLELSEEKDYSVKKIRLMSKRMMEQIMSGI